MRGKGRKRPGAAFVARGLKRLFDSRPLYAQLVVTDDCNLDCAYCNEYSPGSAHPPLELLKRRVDRLSGLGVMVYDLLGGEPLLHPDIVTLVEYIKSRGRNIVIIITNGFLLTEKIIDGLNGAGLDMMQISVDSALPTPSSKKALKSLMPKLKMLAERAAFGVKVQSVLTPDTAGQYGEFRGLMAGLPFEFGFSILHHAGGRIAIQGERYVRLLSEHELYGGMNLYRRHLEEALTGDFSRPWKCLGGSKFLYVDGGGFVRFCSQRRDFSMPLGSVTLADLKRNSTHKSCEAGCVLGCARLISHALGEPVRTIGASLRMVGGLRKGRAEKPLLKVRGKGAIISRRGSGG